MSEINLNLKQHIFIHKIVPKKSSSALMSTSSTSSIQILIGQHPNSYWLEIPFDVPGGLKSGSGSTTKKKRGRVRQSKATKMYS